MTTSTLPALVEHVVGKQGGSPAGPAGGPGRQCSGCVYWVPMERVLRSPAVSRAVGESVGECHRRSPAASFQFPRTHAYQWCGEHEAPRSAEIQADRVEAAELALTGLPPAPMPGAPSRRRRAARGEGGQS
jgi:hypothetical protein